MDEAVIQHVVALERVSMRDVPRVGGKNASLGELLGNLARVGVRVAGGFPAEVREALLAAYRELGAGSPAVAVRSSATAEDLPEASFAGQQETFLNVRGERISSRRAARVSRRCTRIGPSPIARLMASIS